MNRVKTLFSLIICCLLFTSIFSACGNNENDKPVAVGGATDLVKYYNTLDELVADAVEITEIKVIDQETITYYDLPFTISTVTVLSTLKGSLNKGDTIIIVETGGEFVPTDREGKPLPKQTFKLNGIPVLEKNEHEVVFLSKFVGPQVEREAYIPLGAYQGKFKVNSKGKLIQQVPEDGKLKDYKPTKLDDFSDIIIGKNSK